MIDDATITKIVDEYDTPCYIYDETRIRRNIAKFTELSYPHKAIFYASMANNNPQLMRIISGAGLGIFVNSPMHLKIAFDAGFSADRIIYTSTGIRRSDLETLIQHGITVNLDSVSQLALYGSLNPGGEVGIRLNIGESFLGNVFQGVESRIGILESEFAEALRVARDHNVKIVGTHVYLGTDIESFDKMRSGVESVLRLSASFPDLTYVDLGGGFPVNRGEGHDFDYATYDEHIARMFTDYSRERGRDIRLVLEPGRSIFGDTAVFCTRVLDVKDRPDRRLVCCDASATLFPRSMFYEEFHGVEILGKGGVAPSSKPADIVGSTTYSRDFLGRRVQMPSVQTDDLLVFQHSGSYCYSMITQFLGQMRPEELLVTTDGAVISIRSRELAGV